MPLSFRSENTGPIAFGFFNIETDMLLMQNYFFFADRFCRWMGDLAAMQAEEGPCGLAEKVYVIDSPDAVGDLSGAIHGIRFTGFIGRLYRIWPFPRDPDRFRQNPDGFRTRETVEEAIRFFARHETMPVQMIPDSGVWIGPCFFSIPVFHEILLYVWDGGYPRWKDGVRPSYVLDMRDRIMKNNHGVFKGVFVS